MDFIVTESGIYRAGGTKLSLVNVTDCLQQMTLLLARRHLPRQHLTHTSS